MGIILTKIRLKRGLKLQDKNNIVLVQDKTIHIKIMKYIITESKMNNVIKDFLLRNPDIIKVEFATKVVGLGSGPNEKGETSVTQKQILVYIDNIEGNKNYGHLREIKIYVRDILKNLFNLDFETYGSEWDLNMFEVKSHQI
jgi:hypothetical protein